MSRFKKMDPAAKAKWVADLRSGSYTQGTGYLCQLGDFGLDKAKREYCCLGVLADSDPEATWNLAGGKDKDLVFDLIYPGARKEADMFLPEKLRKKYGFSQRVAEILAQQNDEGGTFEEIADWIEANL
jgi:hypothetical protein